MDLRVKGAHQLADLGRDLRQAGDQGKELKREISKAAQRATRPVKREFPAAIADRLPSGLADWVNAALKTTTRIRLSGRNVGVRIRIRRPKQGGEADVNRLDRGRARHPTYGRRPWVLQDVQGQFVKQVMEGLVARRARREFIRAIDEVKAKIRRAA